MAGTDDMLAGRTMHRGTLAASLGRFCGSMAAVVFVVTSAVVASAVTASAQAQEAANGSAPRNDASLERITNSAGIVLVKIPAGEFLMGAPETEEGARIDEFPQHPVTISQPFFLGQYEVTQRQYAQVTGQNPSFFCTKGDGAKKVENLETDDFPVEQVTWKDAVEFCRKLTELPAEQKAGRRYRLPTEAEWQYACRAGTTTPFSSGSGLGAADANINGNFPYGGAVRGPYLGRTTRVGSYRPNAFGLFDMHGNVYEHCHDWYYRYYYRDSGKTDPRGPEDGLDHVIMGGSWSSDALRCRSACRRSNVDDGTAPYFGFRIACDVAVGDDSRSPGDRGP